MPEIMAAALICLAFGVGIVWIDRWHQRYAWRKAGEEARREIERRKARERPGALETEIARLRTQVQELDRLLSYRTARIKELEALNRDLRDQVRQN